MVDFENDELPPLPPPLPPTHARSFSSSSSSSAGGSPRPAHGGSPSSAAITDLWGTSRSVQRSGSISSIGSASTSASAASEHRRRRNATRGTDGADPVNRSRGYSEGPPPALSRTLTSSSAMSSASASSSRPDDIRVPRDRLALSAAAISAADSDFPRSPSASGRFSSPSPTSSSVLRQKQQPSHHTIASLGLGGSPSFPAPSAFLSSQSRSTGREPRQSSIDLYPEVYNQQQSPNESYAVQEGATIRVRPAALTLPGAALGAPATTAQESPVAPSPTRPDRPPRSSARRSASGSAQSSPVLTRSTSVSTPLDTGPAASTGLGAYERDIASASSASSSPVASRSPSLALRDQAEVAGHGGREVTEEQQTHKWERRARRTDELRGRNQRILDSINGRHAARPTEGGLVSPTGRRRSETDRALPSTNGDSGVSAVVRDVPDSGGDLGTLSLLSDEPAPIYRRIESTDSWMDDADLQRDYHSELGELPLAVREQGSFSRSRTLGDLVSRGGGLDTPASVSRRAPSANGGTPSPAGRAYELARSVASPPRASTSMGYSTTPVTGGSLRSTPRRSTMLLASRVRNESERARAATAMGHVDGDAARDAAIERGLRISASRDALSSIGSQGTGTPRGTWSIRERVRSDPRRSVSRVDFFKDDLGDDDVAVGGQSNAASRRHMRAATASPTLAAAVRRPASSLALRRGTETPIGRKARPSAAESTGDRPADDWDDEEVTPKSARRKEGRESGTGGSAARGSDERFSRSTGGRAGSLRNGIESLSPVSPTNATGQHLPPAPRSVLSDDQVSTTSIEARRERLKSVEVGSKAWMAEFDALRARNVRSRASGSSGDAASSARSQPDRERERTVRAINALLADQGIIATAVDKPAPANSPVSPASSASSPQKRSRPSERFRLTSLITAGTPPHSSGLGDRSGAESVLGGLIKNAQRPRPGPAVDSAEAEQHHRLLYAAFDQFEGHFVSSQPGDSAADELVSRMDALVASTTRLNAGLRGLAHGVRDAQVAADLDEERLHSSQNDLAPFEKSVQALLRASDDQVRCLTEDMVAFARLDRDRQRRARREASADAVAGRPVSRASTYRGSLGGAVSGMSMYSPPQRATTASPFDAGASRSGSALVSHAAVSSRSPVLGSGKKEVLRDPLSPALDDARSGSGSVARRHTLGYGSGTRSSTTGTYAGQDSPTPSNGRRSETALGRSPLAGPAGGSVSGRAYETPSRSASAAGILRRQRSTIDGEGGSDSLDGLGLPLPSRTSNAGLRRSKVSDTTVRAPSPTSIRFPTQADHRPTTLVDTSSANTRTSPTQAAPLAPFRAYSDRDPSRAVRALELGANLDEEPARPNSFERDVLGADDEQDEEQEAAALERELAQQLQNAILERDLPDLPPPSPAMPTSVPATRAGSAAPSSQAEPASRYPYAGPVVNIARPQQQESPSGRSKSRLRISSGGLGAALKNALTRGGGAGDRKSWGEGELPTGPVRQTYRAAQGPTPSASMASMASLDRPESATSMNR